MMGVTTMSEMPPSVAFTAIEGERNRLRQLFAGVYHDDGTIDEEALQFFARALYGTERQ